MNLQYTSDDIQTLDGIEHIRHRPSMYIGSIEAAGLQQIWLEILSNSIDEYLVGACDDITVTLLKDGSASISDNGRGIPIGEHQPGISTLQAVFGIVNTGGKYSNDGSGGYNSSGGTNGIGAKATNALSEKFIAKTTREGKTETVIFEEGLFKTREMEHGVAADKHGTYVCFKPDNKVLNVVTFDEKAIKKQIQELSFLCKGLKITFIDEIRNTQEVFLSKNGLLDYLNYLNKDNFICKPFYCNAEDGKSGVEIALAYNNSFSDNIKLYTNNIPQTSGTHLTGFKTAWTSCINQYAREKGLLKEKEENLTGADLTEGQTLILNLRMINPIYQGQNKEVLTSADARTIVQKIAKIEIENWLSTHPTDAKVIINKALNARKARDAAKKARDAIRGKDTKKTKSKFLNLPTKLVDSWSKKRLNCELLITEGDSAGGGLIEGRNAEFQAVFPIRGKILNLYKASLDKIFGNQEVSNIIKALGLEVDGKTGKVIYDTGKLRYGSIILCADGDPDGQAIKNLLLTMFWWICPELILNGHLYVAVPPLFRITTKKNEYIYLKDSKALEEYKLSHKGEKYLVNRNKG